MEYAEIIYELKRLAELSEGINFELSSEITNLVNQYDLNKGDCCG